ncbi:MAG: DUF4388 domain-containing protein [Planctomycetes bacterium]|nr:DUF4388 domain-containing protein [Planctomycetota bacterium]
MAFKGDLRSVQLADLLQTLAQNRQEGVLSVTSPHGNHRVIISREGVSLLDPTILGRRRLGEILVFAEVLSEQDLAAALREQARTKKFLGEVLVRNGKLPQETLDRILAIQVDEEMYELFRFTGGTFEFAECDVPSLLRRNGHSVRPLGVAQVIFEAARRLDEWAEIERVVPSIDGLYLTECAPESVGDDESSREVLARLDGRNTVRDVADSLLDSPFNVAKVLAALITARRARAASAEELLNAARALLAENQKSRALRLLHRLGTLSAQACHLDSRLAEMFMLAGDGKASAKMRYKIAEAARAQDRLDVARRELEAGLVDSPGAPALLQSLVAVLRQTGDGEAELSRLRELSTSLLETGSNDVALATMERLLELAPEDGVARRTYSDLCLRLHLRDKAIEALEKEADHIRRQGRVAELPNIYKRILAIDAGRKDIKRALAAATHSRAERVARSTGVAAAALALALLGGVVGWRRHMNAQRLATIDDAGQKLAAGDAEGARALIDEVLSCDPPPEVTQPALRLLDRVDESIADATRSRRSSRDQQLSTELASIQQSVELRQYDVALAAAVELFHAQKEAYLSDRVRTRLQSITQEFLGHVARAKETATGFRAPTRDDEVAPAWKTMDSAFPLDLVTAATRLREIAFEAARGLEGDVRSWMHDLVAAADVFLALEQRMRPELESLRCQNDRLERLNSLSSQYIEAARAAQSGDVERARELLKRVLAEYGDGELAKVFQERIARLDGAVAAIAQVEALIAAGNIEGANAAARAAADQYRELQLPATPLIPIAIDSLPHGARVFIDGCDAGVTPLVMRLPANGHAEIEVKIPARAPQRTTLSAESPARCLIELPRRTIANAGLKLSTIAAPICNEGRFAVAGRDGSLQSLTLGDDGIVAVHRHASGSLSGALASPLAVPGGFIAALYDGRVVRLTDTPDGLIEVWSRPLDDQFAHSPVRCGDEIAVVGASGRIAWLDLDKGTPTGTLALGVRIAAAPIEHGGRLLVPQVGGRIASIALATHALDWELPFGHDLEHGLACSGEFICAPTSTGELLIIDVRDGTLRGVVVLGATATAAPRAADGIADLPLGHHLVRIDLATATVTHTFTDLAPTATPALIDGRLWVPCEAGVLQVIDPQTGEVLERTRLGGGSFAGAPLDCEFGIALLSRDGDFVLLER